MLGLPRVSAGKFVCDGLNDDYPRLQRTEDNPSNQRGGEHGKISARG